MGALNFVTLGISVLALLFLLIAEGTEDWLSFEYKKIAGCHTTISVKESLYERIFNVELKQGGSCGATYKEEYHLFNVCSDDEAFQACSYATISRGGSGAAVALGVLLVLAQILLIYFESKSKPAATRALSIASYWLFAGVTIAALTCAGAYKTYHDLMCFDKGLGCKVDDDDGSWDCRTTGGNGDDDIYVTSSSECSRGSSWALELVGGLVSSIGLLVLTAVSLVNADAK